MIARMRVSKPRFDLFMGDVLFVTPYKYDDEKYTIVKRLTDDYDPMCNVYKDEVEIITADRPAPIEPTYDDKGNHHAPTSLQETTGKPEPVCTICVKAAEGGRTCPIHP